MFISNRKIVAAVLCLLPNAVIAGNVTSRVAPQGAEVLTVAVIGGENQLTWNVRPMFDGEHRLWLDGLATITRYLLPRGSSCIASGWHCSSQ